MLTRLSYLFLVWNVRGLNDRARRDLVREFVAVSRAVFVVLSESKLESVTPYDVMIILGPRFDGFAYLPAVGTCGGILVGWQSDRVSLFNASLTTNTITLEISPSEGDKWWFTAVYGPSFNEDQAPFLDEICGVAAGCPGR